jgi:predicted nucleic acid-binding protein
VGFVVDANVCAKWFFREDHYADARRLVRSGHRLRAPDLLPSELGSIVWKKCVRGEITGSQGARILRLANRVKVELTPAPELSARALALGLTLSHSFYDCLYLALAQRERVQLVTADKRLHQKLAGTSMAGLTLWIEDVP